MPKLKIHEPGEKSKSYSIKITRPKITIGRKDSNDIIVKNVSVSSNHCEIRRVDGGYILDDLGSTNGSKIKGHRYLKIDLDADTYFSLGDVEVDFSFSEDECDILDAEAKFVSEEEKKSSKKDETESKKAKKRVENEDDLVEEESDEEDDYDDEENEEGGSSFKVIIIAFVATIAVALVILYLTGNLL
jgi:pSer/pThr/pTyr-binding forkhead associated (FHA) protein